MKHVISFVFSGTLGWVTVIPVPVIAAGGCAAGVAPRREPRAFLPSRARVSVPAGSWPRRSARPPGQVSLTTRRIVAPLGGTRTARAVAVRAPEPGQDVLRRVGRPLVDRHETPRPMRHGGAGDQRYCHEGMTLPAPTPRIGQRGQPIGQRTRRAVLTGGRPDQTDGGRLAAHRSSVGRRRLGKVTSATELRRVWSRAHPASSHCRDPHSRGHWDFAIALPCGPRRAVGTNLPCGRPRELGGRCRGGCRRPGPTRSADRPQRCRRRGSRQP